MRQDSESKKDLLRREIFVHLSELRERCDGLLAAKYPLDVYNEVHALRSLVGQLDSAARRWRECR